MCWFRMIKQKPWQTCCCHKYYWFVQREYSLAWSRFLMHLELCPQVWCRPVLHPLHGLATVRNSATVREGTRSLSWQQISSTLTKGQEGCGVSVVLRHHDSAGQPSAMWTIRVCISKPSHCHQIRLCKLPSPFCSLHFTLLVWLCGCHLLRACLHFGNLLLTL